MLKRSKLYTNAYVCRRRQQKPSNFKAITTPGLQLALATSIFFYWTQITCNSRKALFGLLVAKNRGLSILRNDVGVDVIALELDAHTAQGLKPVIDFLSITSLIFAELLWKRPTLLQEAALVLAWASVRFVLRIVLGLMPTILLGT